jgi:hypothetical protein
MIARKTDEEIAIIIVDSLMVLNSENIIPDEMDMIRNPTVFTNQTSVFGPEMKTKLL